MTSQNGAEILGELRRFTNVPEWLSPIADTDLVTEALRSSPPFAPDALKLEAVQISRLRLKRKRWSGLYRLTVTDQAGIRREVALQGTLIPSREEEPGEGPLNGESWRGFVPALRLVLAPQPPDDALGDLDPLTNPAQAAYLLESVLRGSSPVYESVRFASCHPTVLRYKPGSRATVHFELRYARSDQDRGWPDRVIAKTYRDLKGAATYEAMRALWESPLVDPYRLKLADPLAFDKELRLLIQGHIPNTGTLRELIREARRAGTPQRTAEVDDYVRKTGAGLAALHGSGVHVGPRVDVDHEFDDQRGELQELVEVAPELQGAADRLLGSLEDLAMRFPDDPPLPSHGAFRPDQVLLSHGEVGFVDFDGFCQAEPALDVAEFLGKLRSVSLTVGKGEDDVVDDTHLPALFARADQLSELFLTEYERNRPLSRERVALWEALSLLTRLVDGWAKVKPARLRVNVMLMQRFLDTHHEIVA
jgi:hypothetical protein